MNLKIKMSTLLKKEHQKNLSKNTMITNHFSQSIHEGDEDFVSESK